MTLFENFADRARKRALYRQTVFELKRIAPSTAVDLDIFDGDAEKMARKAVYGL